MAGEPGPVRSGSGGSPPRKSGVSTAGSMGIYAPEVIFVGEAKGLWLWALVWPASAGLLLYDSVGFGDLRDGYVEAELAFGSLSPRLGPLPESA